jgi:hypothetical protein
MASLKTIAETTMMMTRFAVFSTDDVTDPTYDFLSRNNEWQ